MLVQSFVYAYFDIRILIEINYIESSTQGGYHVRFEITAYTKQPLGGRNVDNNDNSSNNMYIIRSCSLTNSLFARTAAAE